MPVAVLRKPTIQVALIVAFLLIVALWGYTGYEFTSRMAAVEEASAEVTARYLEAQERLTTIRSQLHSIFSKTGVRRQAQLVALLSKVPVLQIARK